MNEILSRGSLSFALIAGGAGSVAARGAILTERVPVEIQSSNSAFLKEEDEMNVLPFNVSGQPFDPDQLIPKIYNSVARTYPVRRSYGRNGQLGNRTRGDKYPFVKR